MSEQQELMERFEAYLWPRSAYYFLIHISDFYDVDNSLEKEFFKIMKEKRVWKISIDVGGPLNGRVSLRGGKGEEVGVLYDGGRESPWTLDEIKYLLNNGVIEQ